MNRYGWVPQVPDQRDLRVAEVAIGSIRSGPGAYVTRPVADLREGGHLPPVEDQGDIGSCVAQAVVGVVEYTERRRFGQHVDHSRLFLYRVGRKLLFKVSGDVPIGDTGCTIRAGFKALVAFGCPPEWVWPYDESRFDMEPPPFAYSYAQAYQGLYYVAPSSLEEIKALLRNEFPTALGFSVYESIGQASRDGVVPVPGPGERLVGGHAIVAVGYDDEKEHVVFRNSWGQSWGDSGYGYLPYWYFGRGLTSDYWTLLLSEWVNI